VINLPENLEKYLRLREPTVRFIRLELKFLLLPPKLSIKIGAQFFFFWRMEKEAENTPDEDSVDDSTRLR
jgi:hypothetical protein